MKRTDDYRNANLVGQRATETQLENDSRMFENINRKVVTKTEIDERYYKNEKKQPLIAASN